jgi:hypothetical protein
MIIRRPSGREQQNTPDTTSMLNRPAELGSDHWRTIASHADRLERAARDGDLALLVGSAKDLVETIAKIVLELSGEVAPSNAQLPELLSKAHAAIDRQPGQGAAADPPVRNIAQGAKTIISQLPELRNRFGTGHGRVLTPEIDDELASLSLDAALLWTRWVLRRLEQLLAGRPLSLVEALLGGIFYRGDLRNRLQAVQLPSRDPAVQRQIGVAVAHRPMGDTHNVRVEGVDECAEQPELAIWPAGYRAGLLEGLFLDRQGYVDVTAWGAQAAAAVIAPVPSAGDVVQELANKVGKRRGRISSQATWLPGMGR